MNELEILQNRAMRIKEYDKEKRKVSYQYARSLGFDTREAQIMSGWGKARIDRLAKLRTETATT